ncbi:hypothetical protein [Okeania sp. KiyG1]|uniref:hypothetical protein n=1 Tax=Okeania sp. KiyG1 TaxID=2720165 RepID=UPI0019C74314|nr:hypothetical protein [Okeania sp. KiyG1]GGA13449.1 hypothetical protein CYANOKiyG1_26780 [Okeania sp. KiyG1]
MTRGIYITANNKMIEQGIALLKSIRKYDSDTPIILIPYDDNYQTVAERFSRDYGVKIYQYLELIKRLSNKVKQIFGNNFLPDQISFISKLVGLENLIIFIHRYRYCCF